MKIRLYRLPTAYGDDKCVILTNSQSQDGRCASDTYGDIYPRKYFETSSDPIHDCWGGDEISNMCDGIPELITEVEAIDNLSDEDIFNNIDNFIERANRFARVLADEAFKEKIKKACRDNA